MNDKENKIRNRMAYQKQAMTERKNHKLSLERKYNLLGHPKADDLYQLAYDYAYDFGYSSGNSEIEIYYIELSNLLTRFPHP